jgi:hypothetical protein
VSEPDLKAAQATQADEWFILNLVKAALVDFADLPDLEAAKKEAASLVAMISDAEAQLVPEYDKGMGIDPPPEPKGTAVFVLTVKGFATEAEARGAGEAILKATNNGLLMNVAQVPDPVPTPADQPVDDLSAAPTPPPSVRDSIADESKGLTGRAEVGSNTPAPAETPPPADTAPDSPKSILARLKAKVDAAEAAPVGLTDSSKP